MITLALATTNGLVLAARESDAWRVTSRTLEGIALTGVIAREGVILVSAPDGVRRSDNGGKLWRDASEGLRDRYVRWLAYHPDISDREFAGTEPANIYISTDGANSWRACDEVAAVRDAHHWFLPYSSGAGCIRGFSFAGQRAYAAAEVGGALISNDAGATWQLCAGSNGDPDLDGPPAPLIYPDVHSIEVVRDVPDHVYAPTGGGFYGSTDGGATWDLLYDCYVRAMWLDPRDADHVVLGPASSVDREGRIEESRDGGLTWQDASNGLATPWAEDMVERFYQVGEELLAVRADGQVYASPINDWHWRRVLADAGRVNAVSLVS